MYIFIMPGFLNVKWHQVATSSWLGLMIQIIRHIFIITIVLYYVPKLITDSRVIILGTQKTKVK